MRGTPDLNSAWGEAMRALRGAAVDGDEVGWAQGLARWAAEGLRARVRLVPAHEVGDLEVPGVPAADVRRVALGELPGPVVAAGTAVVALGEGPPTGGGPGVLVAERPGEPWADDEVPVLEAVAGGVGLLRLVGQARRLDAVAAEVRVSALQQLMIGDLIRAGRTVEPLVPGLVHAGAGMVGVAECPRGQRPALAVDTERAVGGRGLVVLCPVSARQVIVLYPAGGRRLEEVLGPVVTGRGRAAGVSTVTPWRATANAYGAAVAALAEARGMPEDTRGPRVKVHDGREPLAERLSLAEAGMWAARLLQPLEDLPPRERAALLEAAEHTLWWGPVGGGRLIGWTKKALTARLAELAGRTGLDTGDWWHRAALWLAIQMDRMPPPAAVPGVPPSLVDVLDHGGAREWAAELLGPVSALSRGVGVRAMEAAAAWIGADHCKEIACAALGVGSTQLYKRLDQVGAATHLDRRLPGHRIELRLALVIAGYLPAGSLPAPARRPGGPRTGGRTMTRPPLDMADIDTSRPHAARMYTWYLDGDQSEVNFAADRVAAARALELAPLMSPGARQNRAMLCRFTRFAAREGVRQFLDLGSGIPTVRTPNLHDVVQEVAPEARVVYVDHDPVVLAYAHSMLDGVAGVAYAQADILTGAALYRMDEVLVPLGSLGLPVAIILGAVLHFVPDPDRAHALVRDLAAPLAPGSLICITHTTADWTDQATAVVAHYNALGIPTCTRTREELEAFADPAHLGRAAALLDPGVVAIAEWRPDPGEEVPPPPYMCYAMVIRLD